MLVRELISLKGMARYCLLAVFLAHSHEDTPRASLEVIEPERRQSLKRGHPRLLRAPRSTPQRKYMIDYLLKIFGRQSSRSCPGVCLTTRHHVVSMTTLNPTLYYLPAYIESQRLIETDLASWYLQPENKPNRCASCRDKILFQKCLAVCPSSLETGFTIRTTATPHGICT